jgi:hypothetical protein
VDEVGDLVAAEPAVCGAAVVAVEFGLGSKSFGLGLGDPGRDECRVAAGVEYGPVARDLRVALRDGGLGTAAGGVGGFRAVLVGERGDGVLAVGRKRKIADQRPHLPRENETWPTGRRSRASSSTAAHHSANDPSG